MRRLREALGLPDEAQPPALPKRMEQRVPPPLVPPPPPRRPPPARPVISHVAVARAHEEYRFIEMPHRIGKPAAPRIEVAASYVAHAGAPRLDRRSARRGGAVRNPGSAEMPARGTGTVIQMTIVFSELRDALRERLRVVADHELRDRDLKRILISSSRRPPGWMRPLRSFPLSAIRTCVITSTGKATSRRWPGWKARIHSSISPSVSDSPFSTAALSLEAVPPFDIRQFLLAKRIGVAYWSPAR